MADSIERDKELTIHQRIHAVMMDTGHLEKDGEIKIGGGGYNYISHDAVTAHIRPSFINHGIMVVPTVLTASKDGNRTELTVVTKFINVDDSDNFIEVSTVGYGVDTSDKGPGKAFSYAVKYAYLKVLMLNSADDIEASDVAHDPVDHRKSETDAALDTVKSAREAAAKSLKLAIDGASTVAELKDLRKANADTLEAFPTVTADYFAEQFKEREAKLKEGQQA